jgi:glutamate N-acetyltransferase/amino-acid N-acetyltransferase
MTGVQPTIDHVPGFKTAGIHCGLKTNDALDFALIVSDHRCVAGGVFTKNLVKAAPVLVNQERIQENPNGIRAVAINTKHANACTGQQGIENARQMVRLVAGKVGCADEDVLVLSTGVIGTQLPMEKIARGVELSYSALGENNWEATARGIMTTDTRPKMASVTVTTADGRVYHIAGIAKGAGMIAPNMATMLSVVVTDAVLEQDQAYLHLRQAADHSFNRIVVDGDMSTNDTLLLLANGASGVRISSGEEQAQFLNALTEVCKSLAQGIVRDGEGVTKFITLWITDAPDLESAAQIANTIATSALVKTAFYGSDANWGRIVAAAGRAGVPLQPEKMRLWIASGQAEGEPTNGLLLYAQGVPTDYSEEEATAIMKSDEITVWLSCGNGRERAVVWTCDLSHDYVSINGHYRS